MLLRPLNTIMSPAQVPGLHPAGQPVPSSTGGQVGGDHYRGASLSVVPPPAGQASPAGAILKMVAPPQGPPYRLGCFLKEARQLFIDQGLSEARVSLREVERIRGYLQTFEPSQGRTRALANALWLALGVGLSPEQREGELGQGLRGLILKVEVPGVERERLPHELDRIIQPRPVVFDPSQTPEDALWSAVARGDPWYGPLSGWKRINLRMRQLEWLTDAERSSLIEEIQGSEASDQNKAVTLGRLARNPKLDRETLTGLIRRIQKSKADDRDKVNALGDLAQNPNLDQKTLMELIQWIQGSKADDRAKAYALGGLARNPNLDQKTLTELIQWIQGSKADDRAKAYALGRLARNLKLDQETLTELIQWIRGSKAGDWAETVALGGLARNLNLDQKTYRSVVETIRAMGFSQFLTALEAQHPHATELRRELYERYQAILKGVETLKRSLADSAVRILPVKGDSTDLPDNLAILSCLLSVHNPAINTGPSLGIRPHFDPTLVTAHQLMNRVVQALAVNRFALISGPPASGKSEVGRDLAERLGWGSHIVNCHRYSSQEEMMQRISVVANGHTSFTITDGPLADALLNGRLFIANEINLAKPGSLSFLFSILADVNTTFEYYNPETGKTERRVIHPNFRMIATQNAEGPGRKELNAALKNRAIEIYADRYSDAELAALLRSKYPALAGLAPDMPETLVRLYSDLGHRMASRAMGGHAEGYVWNLRHLMRMAEGFTQTPVKILQTLHDTIGVSLLPGDRTSFLDAVRNFTYNEITVTQGDVDAFLNEQKRKRLADVFQEFGIGLQKGEEIRQETGIVDIPTSSRFIRSILVALKAGYHPWLKGPAGTGKTKLAHLAARLIGANIYEDTFTPQTDESKLKGELKPYVTTLADGSQRLGFTNVPSPLVKALRDKSGGPVVCLLDEAAFGRPDVIEELNTLLDRDGGIWVVSEDGKRQEFLKRPKNFSLILASNTYGYSGVSLQSEAFRSRTQEIFMDFEYDASELDRLFGLPETTPPDDSTPPAPVPVAIPVSTRAAPGGAVISMWQGTAGRLPLSAQKVAPSCLSIWTRLSHGEILSRLASTPAAGPAPDRHLLKTFGNPIRDKLQAMRGHLSESVIVQLETRFAELKNRLLGAAVAMGRDHTIRLEFDPNERTAALGLEEPRVFRVGPDFLLNQSTEDLITIAQHEGAHADISRIGSGFFFKSEKLRALLNVMEDLRVNARAMERAPGRATTYRVFLVDYYHDGYAKLSSDQIPQLLPHEAFLQAIMSREYGETSPWDTDPLVGPALKEAWGKIQAAKALRPPLDGPSEVEVQQTFSQFEARIKDEVLPIYERLYQESVKQISEKLEAGAGKQASPSASQRRSTINLEDLSEKARKILEDRAKTINDIHAPRSDMGERQERARKIYGEDREKPKEKGTKKYPDGSLGSFLEERHADHKRQQADLRGQTYSRHLADLGRLPDQVFATLDQLLRPNTDFEFEGYFTSGPRVDVARAVKALHGLSASLNVFERKTEPTAKNYRFSLLLDASGSMAGARERGGLGMAALFVDVFERLEMPYNLDALHNSYIPLKGEKERLKTIEERNRFFNNIVLNIWGGGATNIRDGIRGIIERVTQERQQQPREQDIIFVLTDGDETHMNGPDIQALCEEAAQRGILIVGIGIGEGMETVRKNFPIHLVESNPLNLSRLLAEFIKEYVKMQMEEV